MGLHCWGKGETRERDSNVSVAWLSCGLNLQVNYIYMYFLTPMRLARVNGGDDQ